MIYSYKKSSVHNVYPHLTVYERYREGVFCGWKVEANAGYLYRDTSATYTEMDEETGEEYPVNRYFRVCELPSNYDFGRFSLVAVPEREAIT